MMNIIELAKQAGFQNDIETVGFLSCDYSELHKFADLVIQQYNAENPVIVTDNTQTIANMEAKIAELEAKRKPHNAKSNRLAGGETKTERGFMNNNETTKAPQVGQSVLTDGLYIGELNDTN